MTIAPHVQRIRRDSALPYYEQLKRLILEQIADGTYETGSMLPPEWQLCETYGISRTVVRQALGELVVEGQLNRHRGKGTFVSARPYREQFIESTVGYFEDLPSGSESVHRKVLSILQAIPPRAVAADLELAPDEPCVEIERQRYVGDDIGSYTRHYLPTTLHPDLIRAAGEYDLQQRSLYEFLDEVCGVQIRSGHRTLEAVPNTPALAKLLGAARTVPVLYIRGVGRDGDGRKVELFEAWHRGDRTQIDIEVAGPTRSAGIVDH
jgi:GntR family transcriptional regulator